MDIFIGEIRMHIGDTLPSEWALCDVNLLQISTQNALSIIIGTTYEGNRIKKIIKPANQYCYRKQLFTA